MQTLLTSTVEDAQKKKSNCFYSLSDNRRKQKDWFLWKNMNQRMSKN